MHRLIIFVTVILAFTSCSKEKAEIDTSSITTFTNDRLNKIKFLNPSIGFVVGGVQFSKPTLLKTIDSGKTWHEVLLPMNNERKEIYNVDIYNGQIITVGYGGTIFVSSDTGETFYYVQHGSWKELKDVSFKDQDHAVIVGGFGFNQGHISEFKSDGNGPNQLKEERNFEISDIDFIDSNIAYLSGYGVIMKSIDGGQNWDFTTAKNDFFTAMTWKNEQEGIAVGYEGSIHKTVNGGRTWKVIRNGNDITKKKLHFLDIERNSNQTIVAVAEKGIVFMSKDDGESWEETIRFYYSDLRGVAFRDDNTCFVVGEKGRMFEIDF